MAELFLEDLLNPPKSIDTPILTNVFGALGRHPIVTVPDDTDVDPNDHDYFQSSQFIPTRTNRRILVFKY